MLRNGCIAVLFALFLSACGSSAKAPVGERGIPSASNPGTHRVSKGESLYSIAWKYGIDYKELAKWNGINSPYTIHANQQLRTEPPRSVVRMPLQTESVKPVPLPTPAQKSKPIAQKSKPIQKPAPPPVASKPVARGKPASTGKPVWQWPAQGRLARKFDAKSTGKKGIAIAGQRNAPVRAAAAGRVVYRGSGLVGYGRLIIVRHNNNYLSAYGHNQELMIEEGDQVRAGQVIARMGSSGTKSVMLHFEIRRNGKPVDPLRLLPRR